MTALPARDDLDITGQNPEKGCVRPDGNRGRATFVSEQRLIVSSTSYWFYPGIIIKIMNEH
jgi:hypothetical protein